MPSDVGSQLVTNFANLAHEGLFGCVLTPIKPSPYTVFKFLSCTEIPHNRLHVFKDLVDGKYHSLIIHTSGIISPHAFPDVEVEVEKLFG